MILAGCAGSCAPALRSLRSLRLGWRPQLPAVAAVALGMTRPGRVAGREVAVRFVLVVGVVVVVVAVPDGIWPWLARRLGLSEPKP